MKTKDVPTVVTFRPDDEDKERIVRLANQYRKRKKKEPKMSLLFRRGLEALEEKGGL